MTDPFEASDSPAPQAGPPSRLNPLHVIWRHKSLLALGLVAGSIVGALVYSRATPLYEASTQVWVVSKTAEPLPLSGGGDARGGISAYPDDYLPTHQKLITSPAVVADAVKHANLGALPSFAGHGNPTGEIRESLKVTRETSSGSPTSILNISYRGTSPEDCPVVLKAVVESYQRFLTGKHRNGAQETAKEIARASDILQNKLVKKEEEYSELCRQHPNLWRGKDGTSVAQDRILALEARRSALRLQEAEVQGRLDAFESAVKDGLHSRAELLAMVNQAPNPATGRPGSDLSSAYTARADRLMALQLQEKTLLEDYGKAHPQVRAVQQQIALLRAQMERPDRVLPGDESGVHDPVKVHLQVLKLDLENIRKSAAVVTKVLAEEQRKAEAERGFEKQEETLRLDIRDYRGLANATAKRLQEVSILQDSAGGFEAEIISPPEPGGKISPVPMRVFPAAALLGLLVGLGLSYLTELADQSFRNPEEIRQRLGLPVVGHIPHFAGQDEETQRTPGDGPVLPPALRVAHFPQSREAEAYRAVRTAVFFHSGDQPHTVIQVTSPDMGDGKTTLIANLAIAMALSEKRVLLIDADFRRPRLHKLFQLAAKQGLASVLSGGEEISDAIQPTAVPGLSVLPCGPIPPNPAELFVLPRFRELLAYLRERYDYVLIDTPPLLAVTDPCVVVPCVDAVLLTVRISKNARPHAARAKEILGTLGARVLGVVVNGVAPNDRAYGSDGSRYGYAYQDYEDYTPHADASGETADANDKADGAGTRHRRSRAPAAPKWKELLGWLFPR